VVADGVSGLEEDVAGFQLIAKKLGGREAIKLESYKSDVQAFKPSSFQASRFTNLIAFKCLYYE
jgi:hypothetical protein